MFHMVPLSKHIYLSIHQKTSVSRICDEKRIPWNQTLTGYIAKKRDRGRYRETERDVPGKIWRNAWIKHWQTKTWDRLQSNIRSCRGPVNKTMDCSTKRSPIQIQLPPPRQLRPWARHKTIFFQCFFLCKKIVNPLVPSLTIALKITFP